MTVLAEGTMTRPDDGAGAEKKRQYSTFRCYVEQGEALNDVASTEGVSIAEVIERHFGAQLEQLRMKALEEKLRRLRKK